MAKAVDFAGFKAELHRRIGDALETTAAHAAYLAREAAPVRKIFKGSRRVTRALSRGEIAAEMESRRKLFGNVPASKLQGIRIERERRPQVPTNPSLRGFGRRSAHNAFFPVLPQGTINKINNVLIATGARTEGRPSTFEEDIGGPLRNLRAVTLKSGVPHLVESAAIVERLGLSGRGRYELRNALKRNSLTTTRTGQTVIGGGLRKSVRVGSLRVNGSKYKISVLAGNNQAYYAKYVEFGTRHAAGQPFLRPALAKVREEYRTRIGRSVTQATGKIRSRGPGFPGARVKPGNLKPPIP